MMGRMVLSSLSSSVAAAFAIVSLSSGLIRLPAMSVLTMVVMLGAMLWSSRERRWSNLSPLMPAPEPRLEVAMVR